MLDLDKVKKLPNYEFKLHGQVHSLDTAILLDTLTETLSSSDSLTVQRSKLQDILHVRLEYHEMLAFFADLKKFATTFESGASAIMWPFALFTHYYHLKPNECKELPIMARIGLQSNIKNIHALNILEQAAAIALVVAPQKVATYLKELGLDIGNDISKLGDAARQAEEEVFDLHTNMAAKAMLANELGLSLKRK